MNYTHHIPAPPLNTYIDDLYYVDGCAPYRRFKVFSMPSLHLMVNLGPAFQVYRAEQADPFVCCDESWWVGPWSTYHIVDWPLNLRFFGVHFKPGGVYPFLRFPLSELHNQVVMLDAIWGRDAADLRERLCAVPTIEAGFALLESALLDRLCSEPHGLDVVKYAIGVIARNHGALSIQALSDQIGISQNHLRTQFNRIVGIPPKELARCYRFAHVLGSIDLRKPVDWTRIAHECCYFDQSHFIKDFIAFTGHTPGDYLRRRLEAGNAEQLLGQIPTD
jgi:AraC-like DNA-binding protein